MGLASCGPQKETVQAFDRPGTLVALGPEAADPLARLRVQSSGERGLGGEEVRRAHSRTLMEL
jgi:hypothetical protein